MLLGLSLVHEGGGCGSKSHIFFVTFKFWINTFGLYNNDSEPGWSIIRPLNITRGDFGDFCLIDNKEITLDTSDTSCYLFLY